ncbi:hypothetical protein V1525DRAFT_399518 [Lipomyces kononenkoae]|uniref:Uncharacterized protein n=1 Tax=Lipomyces kononenkoae TaxID=34357 RepID=A0ACC3T5W5_LIPKO
MTWLEDYCFVCDKVCPAGSIYCSETCKLADHEKARTQPRSASVSPPLLPVQSSASESGRRSSAVQVQVEMSPPNRYYFVPLTESWNPSSSNISNNQHNHDHDVYYNRLQSGMQRPARYTSAVPRRPVAPNTLLYGI